MSTNCGQFPVYIPTYINLKARNIDAVDVAATNISCTNLSIQGNPVSDLLQLMTASNGTLEFTGPIKAGSTTLTSVTAASLQAGDIYAFDVNASQVNSTEIIADSITARNNVTAGAYLIGTLSTDAQPYVTSLGVLEAINTSGNIIQTGGSTTLLDTNVSSLRIQNTLLFLPTYEIIWEATQTTLTTTHTTFMPSTSTITITAGTWRIDCSALYQVDSSPAANSLYVRVYVDGVREFEMRQPIPIVSTTVTGTVSGSFIFTTTTSQVVTATARLASPGTTANMLSSTSSAKNSLLSVFRIA